MPFNIADISQEGNTIHVKYADSRRTDFAKDDAVMFQGGMGADAFKQRYGFFLDENGTAVKA